MKTNLSKIKKKKKNYKLYSFDIFDTLVTRRVAIPTGIFALMQEYLKFDSNFSSYFKNNFYEIRIASESLARNSKSFICNTREVTFEEIYFMMSQNYNLNDNQKNYLMNLELEIEKLNLVPIEENINKLKNLISANKKVILISDMYFTQKELRYILSSVDNIFDEIKIYVSSELGVSKNTKDLYKLIREKENIDFVDWIHLGDNKVSDIRNARKFGIKTSLFETPKELEHENEILSKNLNSILYQYVIGSSRLARFQYNNDNYDLGASFAGPILYSYVDFVLQQAIDKNYKTLYFVARDGYILKIIADIIIKNKKLSIQTKYFYGSRLAWRIPTTYNFDKILTWIFEEYPEKLSLSFIAKRLNISIDILKTYTRQSFPINKILNAIELKQLYNSIKESKQLKDAIIAANLSKVELLHKYIKQEINFKENNIVFVELQGTGKTQDALAEHLNYVNNCIVHSYYLHNSNLVQSDISKKYSFCKQYPWALVLELLCKNTEGQTLGYSQNNEIIEPINEYESGKNIEHWGWDNYKFGVINYTKLFVNAELILNRSISSLKLFNDYYQNLLDEPANLLANTIGSIPSTQYGLEKNAGDSAPKARFYDYINLILGKSIYEIFLFPFLSIKRSNIFFKILVKLVEKYGSIRKFLINLKIHRKEKELKLVLIGVEIDLNHFLGGKQ